MPIRHLFYLVSNHERIFSGLRSGNSESPFGSVLIQTRSPDDGMPRTSTWMVSTIYQPRLTTNNNFYFKPSYPHQIYQEPKDVICIKYWTSSFLRPQYLANISKTTSSIININKSRICQMLCSELWRKRMIDGHE